MFEQRRGDVVAVEPAILEIAPVPRQHRPDGQYYEQGFDGVGRHFQAQPHGGEHDQRRDDKLHLGKSADTQKSVAVQKHAVAVVTLGPEQDAEKQQG